MSNHWQVDEQIRQILAPDEQIHAQTRAAEADVTVTDRRLLVSTSERLALNVPVDRIRRIEFDVERGRPATLVIVPEHPRDQPQVLAIPMEELEATAQALAHIGRRFAEAS
jgi:hypothetical protein